MGEIQNKRKPVPGYKRNASTIKLIGACVFVCLVFLAGFLVRGNAELMGVLGVDPVPTAAEKAASGAASYDTLASRVAEVETILRDDSIDSFDLTTATDQVVESFISTAGDSYLHYYDAAAYATYLASTADPESGIGVLFGEKDGTCYVVDVFEGSQAQASGILPGDYVEAIDGVEKDVWTMAEVVNTLNREDGQTVYVTWRRQADAAKNATVFTTQLPYGASSVDNITLTMEGDVAVIDVKQLSSDSSAVLRSTLEQATGQGARSVVLDLRDVPGGYLTQAVEMAGLFVQTGTLVQIRTNDALTAKSASGDPICSLPLVVLANGRTAGSAEVLAAALQETDRATVVGTVTQGKGSVQVLQPLSFGGALRYTAATYLTPKGRSLDGTGVSPDISISDQNSQEEMAYSIAASQAS